MRFKLTLFWLLVCGLATIPPAEAVQTHWLYDYDTALQLARDKHMPMIVFFFVRGQEYTQRVEESFADEAVALQTDSFVCVRLDGSDPAMKPLLTQYQVSYLPDVFWTDEWGRRAVDMSPPIDAADFAYILAFEVQYLKKGNKFFPFSKRPGYKYPPQLWPAPPPRPAPKPPAAAKPANAPDKNPPTESGVPAGAPEPGAPAPLPSLAAPAPPNPGSPVYRLNPATPPNPSAISPPGQPRAALTWPGPSRAVAAPHPAPARPWQSASAGNGIFLLDDTGVTPLAPAPSPVKATAKPASIPTVKNAKTGKKPLPKPKAGPPR